MELTLLEAFSWNVAFPTAAHFANYFLTAGVTTGDYHGDMPVEYDKVSGYLQKYMNYFLEISLQRTYPVYT